MTRYRLVWAIYSREPRRLLGHARARSSMAALAAWIRRMGGECRFDGEQLVGRDAALAAGLEASQVEQHRRVVYDAAGRPVLR